MKLKRIVSLIICLATVFALSACTSNGAREEKPKFVALEASGAELAVENSRYVLTVDETGNNITLTDKTTAVSMSTIAEDADSDSFKNQQILKSALQLEYMTQLQNSYETAYSADTSVCTAASEKTEDGIKVTYCFNELQISIPVVYSLNEKGFSAEVDLNSVAEGGEYMIGKISVLPLAARAVNGGSGYLFIPSGCGGISLMSNTVTRTYDEVYEKIYGEDRNNLWTLERVYLPVYGSKDGDKAVFCMIESGAETARINALVNDTKYGSSFVYPAFTVRDYEYVKKGTTNGGMESRIYDEDIADNILKVNYCLLEGDKADYTGMAEVYRDYLDHKYGKAEKKSAPMLALKFLGGVEEKKFAFGIPYYSLFELTTVSEAREITDEISKATGIQPLVQLVGFGKDGLENGTLAGGYKIASSLGSFEEIADWQKEAAGQGTAVALDFDIVNYSNSGSGFSVKGDSAKSAADNDVEYYYTQVALLSENKMLKSYYRLSRACLNNAGEKLLNLATKKKLGAVSLSTLGTTVYADYGNRKYYSGSNMPQQVEEILGGFKEKEITLLSNAAFEYAAGLSDYVLDAPIQSSRSDVIDEEIPFYQMVLGAGTALYNIPVNLTIDDNTAILKAAEAGTGLSYTICKNYSTKLLSSSQKSLYASDYDGVKERITEQAEEYAVLYNKISDASIARHSVLENGIRKTVFTNGVTVYVNYGYEQKAVNGMVVPPRSYITEEA